jgi:DNA-binding Lrp family transcriptional regulator
MDELDRKMLMLLFRDGRISQRRLAEELNVTPPTLNYRFRKLEEEGVLKGFTLFVNPNFLSLYYGFVAFTNYRDYDSPSIFLKFKCVEWLNVYGILGRSFRELDEEVERMSRNLGEPKLKYVPEQSPESLKEMDLIVLRALKDTPRASESEIAEVVGMPSKLVSKRLKVLSRRGVFSVFPVLDIPKSGLIMFSMFSRELKRIVPVLEPFTVFRITDGKAGINVCLADNMGQVRNLVNGARLNDPDSDVMIIHEYTVSIQDKIDIRVES